MPNTENKHMDKSQQILSEFATPEIVVVRKIKAGTNNITVMFLPTLTDKEIIREAIFALVNLEDKISLETIQSVLYNAELLSVDKNADALNAILSGDTLLVINNSELIAVGSRKWEKRSIVEPPTETVIAGPREGFIEDLNTNLSLLQRRLKSPHFALKKMTVGRQSSTDIVVAYMDNIAKKEIVEQVMARIRDIDIDAIIDSNYIQHFLEAKPLSIFSQTGSTEKPDVVTSKLLEGRVAIIVNGSPMVITVPYLLIEDLHSSEDYYVRSTFATFLRFLRYFSILVSVLLPGIYVSLQVFHYEIIPMRFLITLIEVVQGIPMPPLIEILFVIVLFEIIRESSVRMPRAVGMAMSIVGALVLGETAVRAGMISSPAVMIVALSSIALYSVPNQVPTFSLLRIAFTLAGGYLGLYGIIVGCIFVIGYLTSLDSFETPYLAPIAPYCPSDIKDGLMKAPLVNMDTRPKSIPNKNSTRMR